MKNIFNIIIISFFMLLTNCSIFDTHLRYFDDNVKRDYQPKTDLQKFINDVLHRIINENSYETFKQRKIYVTHSPDLKLSILNHFDEIQVTAHDQEKISIDDLPPIVNGFKLCLKTQEELQIIADKSNEFEYLFLGEMQINEKFGNVIIGFFWQTPSNARYIYLSGGFSNYQFIKVNGVWIFDKILWTVES
jgi:hypothetical protein